MRSVCYRYDQLQLSHGQHNASFVARAANAGLTVLKVRLFENCSESSKELGNFDMFC